jgi:hypothetical protein
LANGQKKMINEELHFRLEAKPRNETDAAAFFHLARQPQYGIVFFGIHSSNSGQNIIIGVGIPVRKQPDSCASGFSSYSSQHNQDFPEADAAGFKPKVGRVKP